MTKEIITPKEKSYLLPIPEKYIGKRVEVLLYSLDEISEDERAKTKKTIADFFGTISETAYRKLKTHTEQARQEWDRNI
jgi:hypothetical protein